jgi:hypothetical protein
MCLNGHFLELPGYFWQVGGTSSYYHIIADHFADHLSINYSILSQKKNMGYFFADSTTYEIKITLI